MLIQDIQWVFVYNYSSYLSLHWERCVPRRYCLSQKKGLSKIIELISIFKIIALIRPVDEWSDIEFSARQNAENEHCETLKELVHKLNFQH